MQSLVEYLTWYSDLPWKDLLLVTGLLGALVTGPSFFVIASFYPLSSIVSIKNAYHPPFLSPTYRRSDRIIFSMLMGSLLLYRCVAPRWYTRHYNWDLEAHVPRWTRWWLIAHGICGGISTILLIAAVIVSLL